MAGFDQQRAAMKGVGAMEPVVAAVRRRPKDRKQQILEHAVALFIERGFHSVKLEEIAEAAGVTARALYRHYENKQALLAAAIVTAQEEYQNALQRSGHERTMATPALHTDLPGLIAAAVATRALTVLWQREARYLNETDRAEVRRRINAIVAGMDAGVRLETGDLSPQHSELRAWAVSSTLTSLGRHDVSLPGDELSHLLFGACLAAARTPPVHEMAPAAPTSAQQRALFSRHETLLATGARLFRAHGYPAVSTSEIGKGAGIAGPGLYRSFSSKQAILDALIRRLDEWWNLEAIRTLRADTEAAQRLRDLVGGHVRISLEDPDLVAVSVTELPHASIEVRDSYLRNQADRENLWSTLVCQLIPTTTATQAWLLVAAAMSFIEDAARTWHLTRYTGVSEEITAIAMSILTSAAP